MAYTKKKSLKKRGGGKESRASASQSRTSSKQSKASAKKSASPFVKARNSIPATLNFIRRQTEHQMNGTNLTPEEKAELMEKVMKFTKNSLYKKKNNRLTRYLDKLNPSKNPEIHNIHRGAILADRLQRAAIIGNEQNNNRQRMEGWK